MDEITHRVTVLQAKLREYDAGNDGDPSPMPTVGLGPEDTITSEVASQDSDEDTAGMMDRASIEDELDKLRVTFWKSYRTKLYKEDEDWEMSQKIL